MVHIKSRSGFYLKENIARFVVPDNLVPWSVDFEKYNPVEYNSPILKGKPYADPDISDPNFKPKWNQLDGKINRKSHMGDYLVVTNRPLNPEGRTGLKGRGILGKWGPNHAADPIVTRWKKLNEEKQFHKTTKLPILQFCGIQRRDNNEWAIPGGMVDPGENVSETLYREFSEEALNSLENGTSKIEQQKKIIEDFFSKGHRVYSGYVDDPRNTDNAWMETVAVNFHDENGDIVGKFPLEAGDDAKNIRWIDVDKNVALYASHSNFIKIVAHLRGAHW